MSQLPTPSHHSLWELVSSIDQVDLNFSSPLLHLKVGLIKLGLDPLLGNPHTPSSLDTDKAIEPTIFIFFIAMALLLQLLLRQQRRWEKAFKIGYYRHLGAAGAALSRC